MSPYLPGHVTLNLDTPWRLDAGTAAATHGHLLWVMPRTSTSSPIMA